jgi:hypothetical protein
VAYDANDFAVKVRREMETTFGASAMPAGTAA